MRAAGAYSGAYVVNVTTASRPSSAGASNAPHPGLEHQLFTTAAALARFGTEGTLGTEVLGMGELDEEGVWRGDLYLRGGGDPTFGSRRFTRAATGRRHRRGAGRPARGGGIERVTGRVYGDESAFDSLRGGPESGYGESIWVGPLSALSFNRGLGHRDRPRLPGEPAAVRGRAARRRARGGGRARRPEARAGVAPGDAEVLASVDSPPMGSSIRLTNKPSDNFFAEMLLKGLALQARGKGTTRGRARRRRLRAAARRPARLADGSGLSRGDRASPRQVVTLLTAMYRLDEDIRPEFVDSLPIAGRDGTLSTGCAAGRRARAAAPRPARSRT